MSYEISLYDKAFLIRAISEQLGDWTMAPAIPEPAVKALLALALANGFSESPLDPDYVAFCKERGTVAAPEFVLDTPLHLAQLTLHGCQLAFSIPWSERASESIALCSAIARSVAHEFSLGYNDPQTGEEP